MWRFLDLVSGLHALGAAVDASVALVIVALLVYAVRRRSHIAHRRALDADLFEGPQSQFIREHFQVSRARGAGRRG